MHESAYAGAVAAGVLCGGAILAAGLDLAGARVAEDRLAGTHRLGLVFWSWLAIEVDRAGWRASPRVVFALGLGLGSTCGVVTALAAPWLGPVGFAAGCGVALLTLASAVDRRRRRLADELAPLLELLTLELSAGGSPLAALGSVTMQVDAELAASLRTMLIASQVGGSQSFETRLIDYSDRIQLPALSTLATILGANRDFGTGASQGVRALATDLRRAQRRDLIAHSRKALNHVLLPAALGVLLPFLAVLMYPAVSVLQRSLR